MDPIRDTIRSVLARFPQVRLCILFGAAASGRSTQHSDVDVAVAAAEPLSLDARLELQQAISTAVQREVDLIDLAAETGPILKQALSKGILIQNLDKPLYAGLISRMLFSEADMMPYYNRILNQRRERFLHG